MLMLGSPLENMIRYYHGEGGAVYGDNQAENDKLWDFLSQKTKGMINGISIETRKKVGPPPSIECSSAVQAIEVADVMNKAQKGQWFTAVLGLIQLSR